MQGKQTIFALWTAAFVLGRVSTLARMPPLLGMLLAGIMLRNIELRSFQFVPESGTFLRKFAFVIILLRAGLGLDPEALKRLKGVCVRLSLLSCSFEALAVCFSSWIMFGFRPIYGLLLGFVLAAVSPGAVVACMLDLQKTNLGVERGIPTLVTAVLSAATMDDVYAITIFSSLFSMVKSPGYQLQLDKQDSGSILTGLLVLLIGLIVRTFVAFISAFGTSLNVKERLFVAIAWLPKTTVQV
ncbi:sodium/hydrogen exchanger family domain-containing protein [Ditylenchus destructor]|uniref:Sodium/hydrogen exchanger family domain-containing protein n=1 Tax=Ditylenchus destructor TaxID=166010 RepID=A0AAD4QUH0_9BILA|nr:sodium/hydrogen exchanger family domain-containing protein [Ditylenchus destructor]